MTAVVDGRTPIQELLGIATERYEGVPANPLVESIEPEDLYAATPNRLAYAIGWLVASEIVYARFPGSAIDVLPVFHPDAGWDRMLVTRRTSGLAFSHQPANEFGMIMLDGEDPPRYTSPGGKLRVAIGTSPGESADSVLKEILEWIPSPALGRADSNRLLAHEQAPRYPMLMRAVSELIAEFPGLTAAREIFIDDKEIDGQYHPLHLHAAELTPMGPDDRAGANVATTTYRWFQLQYGEMFAFFDKRGNRAVYRTDKGTWSRVRKQLDQEESVTDVKRRIMGWMRLGGSSPSSDLD